MKLSPWLGGCVAAFVACAAAAPATAETDLTVPLPREPQSAPSGPSVVAPVTRPSGAQPVDFERLVVRLPVGAVVIVQQSGMWCAPVRTTTWPGGQAEWKVTPFKLPFRTEFVNAGLKVEGDPDNLFEADTQSADLAIGGIVTDMSQQSCTPNVARPEQKGSVTMSIEWELYSRLQKQIVGTFTTTGSDEIAEPTPGGVNIMLSKAFAANVRQLAANPQLRKLVAEPALGASDLVRPPTLDAISFADAAGTIRNVDSTVDSVVLIRAGAAEGSGVLVSSDGYILTAEHVVGDAPTVRVRWSDGTETDASVVRVSKGRDVALLKTNARGRKPLALRRDEPPVGEPVFAVGSTMGDRFQSSVTKGVISADRVIDGYAYIQSDVTVGPGASGGPLLDSEGRVIGLTHSIMASPTLAAAPTGIHLFVPTRDAIDFLGLRVAGS